MAQDGSFEHPTAAIVLASDRPASGVAVAVSRRRAWLRRIPPLATPNVPHARLGAADAIRHSIVPSHTHTGNFEGGVNHGATGSPSRATGMPYEVSPRFS